MNTCDPYHKTFWHLFPLLLLLSLLALPAPNSPAAHAAGPYVVNITSDGPDSDLGDGICYEGVNGCSLRAAIQQASADGVATTITFEGAGAGVPMKLADGFVDRLMGEANDLVVDTDSMFVIDPVPSAQLLEKLPFGKNGEIYHTVYFNQPQVARQCASWLGLLQASRAVSATAPRSWWKEAVSDDFRIIPGQISISAARSWFD